MQVSKAYRKLSVLVHPDKNPGDAARAAFEALNEAHRLLKDASKLVGAARGVGFGRDGGWLEKAWPEGLSRGSAGCGHADVPCPLHRRQRCSPPTFQPPKPPTSPRLSPLSYHPTGGNSERPLGSSTAAARNGAGFCLARGACDDPGAAGGGGQGATAGAGGRAAAVRVRARVHLHAWHIHGTSLAS